MMVDCWLCVFLRVCRKTVIVMSVLCVSVCLSRCDAGSVSTLCVSVSLSHDVSSVCVCVFVGRLSS